MCGGVCSSKFDGAWKGPGAAKGEEGCGTKNV